MKRRKKWFDYSILLGLSLIFLLVFSYSTSPLYPYAYGWDSDFFRLVGEGMTKGKIPYRDFFDMKGPWLFFIEYLGQLSFNGKTGAFIIQWFHFYISLIFSLKIMLKFNEDNYKTSNLFSLIPLLVIYAVTMEGGNVTEDLSLPYLMIPLYVYINYLKNENSFHKPIYGLVYGICFGILALIRITNSVLICSIVFTVFIELIREKERRCLYQNILSFLSGVLISFILPIVYYGSQNEISNMLYCTFVFGFLYGTESLKFGTGFLYVLNLVMSIVILIILQEKNRKLWCLICVNTIGMFIVLAMGNSSLHDYLLVIPGMMLGVWKLISYKGNFGKKRLLALTLLIIVCFSYPGYKLLGTVKSLVVEKNNKECYLNVKEIVSYIPKDEENSVLGYDTPIRWYTIADIMPCNKYLAWQEHYMELSEVIQIEIYDLFENNSPKWVVTEADKVFADKYIEDIIKKRYYIAVKNEDFILYGLVDSKEKN